MKLLPYYRVRRSPDREMLSSLYAVDLIIIAVMYLSMRSLQSSVSVKGLRGFSSILHTVYYKGADSDNAEFLCSVKTSLRFSVLIILT